MMGKEIKKFTNINSIYSNHKISSGYDRTKVHKESCTQCGECCADTIPLTDEEIKMMKDYVQRNGIKPNLDKSKTATIHFKIDKEEMTDFKCPLRNENGCMIYKVRPYICRVFSCDDQVLKKLHSSNHMGPEYKVTSVYKSIFNK